jgi:hypothetical protein
MQADNEVRSARNQRRSSEQKSTCARDFGRALGVVLDLISDRMMQRLVPVVSSARRERAASVAVLEVVAELFARELEVAASKRRAGSALRVAHARKSCRGLDTMRSR